jgi:hypothetical protein
MTDTKYRINAAQQAEEKRSKHDQRKYMTGGNGSTRQTPGQVVMANLAQYFEWAVEGRQEKDWQRVGFWSLRVCDQYANLSQIAQEALGDVFPNPPAFLGEWSGVAWIAYLSALLTVKERREYARTRLRAAAQGSGDCRVEYAMQGAVCGGDMEEPPF